MILKQRFHIGLYDSETEGPDRVIFKVCLMILKQRVQIGLYLRFVL
jgi:hypothetical protein